MDSWAFISIFGLFLSFAIGFFFKEKYAWFLIWTMPILASGRVIFVPSHTFPLDFYQITFFGILGILYKRRLFKKMITSLSKDPLFILILIFTLIHFIVSESDRYPYLLFGWIPQIFIGYMLTQLIVQTPDELQKMLKIFALQGAFIGLFIIIGFFTDFRLEEVLRSTIPGYDVEKVSAFVRAYNVRVNGLDGSAVLTAARMVVLLFTSLYYYYSTRSKVSILYLILIIIGIVLLQTRAAFVAIAPPFVLFLIFYLRFSTTMKKRIILKNVPLIVLAVGTLSKFSTVLSGFIPMLVDSVSNPFSSASVLVKIDRIPIAIDYFLQRPFSGFGSPNYVYYNMMHTADLPAPILYLVAGGIGMFTIYSAMLFYMPFRLYQIFRQTREIPVLFISLALLAGVIMPLSNWIETHFVIMLMLYSAVNRVYSDK